MLGLFIQRTERGHRGWSGMTEVENESRIQKVEGVKGGGKNHYKDLRL